MNEAGTCLYAQFQNQRNQFFCIVINDVIKIVVDLSFVFSSYFFCFQYFCFCKARLPIQSASSLVSNGVIGKNGKGKSGNSANNKVLRDSITQAYLYSCSSLTRLLSRSPEWANISEKQREKLGLTFNDDGEFWYEFLEKLSDIRVLI